MKPPLGGNELRPGFEVGPDRLLGLPVFDEGFDERVAPVLEEGLLLRVFDLDAPFPECALKLRRSVRVDAWSETV